MDDLQLLQQLHDIQLPSPIPFWPMAPGWWFLAILMLALLIIGSIKSLRLIKRHQKIRAFEDQIQQLNHLYQLEPQRALAELSILIKRIALTVFPRAEITPLKGQAWLTFLDKTGQTQGFSEGIGQCLATAPYQANPQVDFLSLTQLVQQWFKQVTPHG